MKRFIALNCRWFFFFCSQRGILFVSVRARRGASWWSLRCLLSGTIAILSIFPGCAERKLGCPRREAPTVRITQNYPGTDHSNIFPPAVLQERLPSVWHPQTLQGTSPAIRVKSLFPTQDTKEHSPPGG